MRNLGNWRQIVGLAGSFLELFEIFEGWAFRGLFVGFLGSMG